MWKLTSEGKVRSVYQNNDIGTIALVASDRVSAFDKALGVEIPGKGQVLTKMSAFWFKKTRDLVPNAFVTADDAELDEFFAGNPECAGRTTEMLQLVMLPVELIVRGYITGSAWKAYAAGAREICGVTLPDGLINSEVLPEPIFTPTTKAPEGQHDENITYERLREEIKPVVKLFDLEPRYVANRLRECSLQLYEECAKHAFSKGIIIADTKFEFGISANGELLLADELFTPDSSRFWSVKDYQPGQEQSSFDKQIIRNYVSKMRQECGEEATFPIPKSLIKLTARRYEEAYEMISS